MIFLAVKLEVSLKGILDSIGFSFVRTKPRCFDAKMSYNRGETDNSVNAVIVRCDFGLHNSLHKSYLARTERIVGELYLHKCALPYDL